MGAKAKPPKKGCKKCPSCRFDACFIHAPQCEKCGYDFRLGRKPRSKVISEDFLFDDDEPEVKEEPKKGRKKKGEPPSPVLPVQLKPVVTKKKCPLCKHENFHRAIMCELCEKWSFLDGGSEIIQKKIKTKEEEKVETAAQLVRNQEMDEEHLIAAVYGFQTNGVNRSVIVAVAGPPPVKLRDFTKDSVREWVSAVFHWCHTTTHISDPKKWVGRGSFMPNPPSYNCHPSFGGLRQWIRSSYSGHENGNEIITRVNGHLDELRREILETQSAL